MLSIVLRYIKTYFYTPTRHYRYPDRVGIRKRKRQVGPAYVVDKRLSDVSYEVGAVILKNK